MKACWTLVLVLMLGSCASTEPHLPVQPLLATPLPPESLGYRLSMSQVVASKYKGETHSLRVEVEVSPDRLVMVGVSHIGVPLFQLELDHLGLRTKTLSGESLPFEPSYILSDFQLAYWPFDRVQQELAQQGYILVRGLKATSRYIYDSKQQLLASVEILSDGSRAGYMVIEHHDLPYQLLIQTLDRTEGS
jgi:hypothetical protein